jgi:hypothetical protein
MLSAKGRCRNHKVYYVCTTAFRFSTGLDCQSAGGTGMNYGSEWRQVHTGSSALIPTRFGTA